MRFEGKDLCTLMTCTPYGINSHRLLVQGERIEDMPLTTPEPVERFGADEYVLLAALFTAVIMAILITIVVLVKRHRERKDEEEAVEGSVANKPSL